jgi:hypothetical protein
MKRRKTLVPLVLNGQNAFAEVIQKRNFRKYKRSKSFVFKPRLNRRLHQIIGFRRLRKRKTTVVFNPRKSVIFVVHPRFKTILLWTISPNRGIFWRVGKFNLLYLIKE